MSAKPRTAGVVAGRYGSGRLGIAASRRTYHGIGAVELTGAVTHENAGTVVLAGGQVDSGGMGEANEKGGGKFVHL